MKMQSEFSSKQAKYFDKVTESRERAVFFADNRALSLEFEAMTAAMVDLREKKILDVGCGSGRHAIRLAQLAQSVVGTDISEKSVDLANSGAREGDLHNFTGVVSDYSVPFKTGYFDYAIMVNAIHHIDNVEQVLGNVQKSLKNDGELIIFEFNPLNILFIPFLAIHGQIMAHLNMRYVKSNIISLKKSIRNSGLDIIDVERYAFLPTILYNYSSIFIHLNKLLNSIPIVNQFCAFHIIRCKAKQ